MYSHEFNLQMSYEKNNWGDNRFFEQKNNTKKINPIFKQKLGMTLKQEITTWIPKSEFGLEHPISWKKYKTSVITCFEFKSKILRINQIYFIYCKPIGKPK